MTRRSDQNVILVDQNDLLDDQNDVLVDQNDVLVDQNDVLVDQNVVLVDHKTFSQVFSFFFPALLREPEKWPVTPLSRYREGGEGGR